jgi:hypothetical protein
VQERPKPPEAQAAEGEHDLLDWMGFCGGVGYDGEGAFDRLALGMHVNTFPHLHLVAFLVLVCSGDTADHREFCFLVLLRPKATPQTPSRVDRIRLCLEHTSAPYSDRVIHGMLTCASIVGF